MIPVHTRHKISGRNYCLILVVTMCWKAMQVFLFLFEIQEVVMCGFFTKVYRMVLRFGLLLIPSQCRYFYNTEVETSLESGQSKSRTWIQVCRLLPLLSSFSVQFCRRTMISVASDPFPFEFGGLLHSLNLIRERKSRKQPVVSPKKPDWEGGLG